MLYTTGSFTINVKLKSYKYKWNLKSAGYLKINIFMKYKWNHEIFWNNLNIWNLVHEIVELATPRGGVIKCNIQ